MSEFTQKFKKGQGIELRPDLINGYSRILCRKYSSYFKNWWDPERFNWFFKKYLIYYCSSDILIWFDKEKIDIWDLDPCTIVLLKKHGKL